MTAAQPFRYSLLILCIAVFLSGRISAGQPDGHGNPYDVVNIPSGLRGDAGAVIRTNSIRFEIKDDETAVEKVKIAVTIFTKDKRDYGVLVLGYDKFLNIEDLDGTLYDMQGNEIRDLERSDVKDQSMISDYSLFEDSRRRIAELYYDRYPYTVEFTYEISYDGFVHWPSWYSQNTLDPVQETHFDVVIPEGEQLRYWCNRDSIAPRMTSTGSTTIYSWNEKMLPGLSKDVYGENIEDVATVVRIAPAMFVIDGNKGDMRTWKSFGLWYYRLGKGRDKLPESAVHDIHSIIQPNEDITTKAQAIYRYMQQRTRYVNVTLGIGGWQPFDASYVHEHGYGDCKALSNYMIALLKEAGVPAYPVLIESGLNPDSLIQSFSCSQFNHVIVAVPENGDTLWLECTSQTMPAGHLGRTTENRQALMITPDGGVVVRTPASSPEENRQTRILTAALFNTGTVEASTDVTWSDDQQDYVRNEIENASPQERIKWIMNSTGVPNMTIRKYSFEGIDDHVSDISLHVELQLPRYASVSGTRIFFQPNMMERRTYIPPELAFRFSPIRFSYPYVDSDSAFYSIPAGYTAESVPKDVRLESSFASFSSTTVLLADSAVVFHRELRVLQYTVPAERYSEYRNFFASVVKADRAQVVLVKK